MTVMTTSPLTTSGSSAPRHHQPLETILTDKPSQKLIHTLSLRLRRNQISGPEAVASTTAKALRSVVSSARYSSMQDLIDIIKCAGRYLQLSQPAEQTIGNITRRVVHLLREEAKAALLEAQEKEGGGSLSGSVGDLSSFAPESPVPPVQQQTRELTPAARPGPYPLRVAAEGGHGSSAFVHGSFSISDLVAAGAMASSSSSLAHTPNDGSYAGTPRASLSRKGSGTFDHSLAQISQQMSGVSLAEDAAGEAEAEEEMGRVSGLATQELDDEDESDDDDDDDEDEEDDGKLVTGKKSAGAYFLKPLLIQAIQDLIDELETVDDNISKVSRDHIHSGEVILTLGSSATVQGFFTAAAKDRKFTVIVPESAPSYSGHSLARSLTAAGISVLLIPDSSIFAMMPRVSKVVLGAHAVLANGGVISAAGSYATALAAQQHSTPVMILTGVYKICPEWSSIQNFAQASGSVGSLGPAALLDFANSSSVVERAEVVSNAFDYVSPGLVDVFITNVGEHPPSYVYRLVKENYHQDDIVL
ncbi:Initiation factor 2B-related [Kalmanozyma brasiliensis GHG001]|uniref:Translation initiation factor eIF2B subunit beta n=1 Tax=Kalmanozyma brasiliensis (strain GHG001) TaxID=1365824 RepID=V5GK99_KALBG|nr:Initiation factor 2B-related [Kalmanozyma brasiliensis GHG001]EST06392.1 Initiation factor 2B-related [Kalmanozyma brasiliensis GHG001]